MLHHPGARSIAAFAAIMLGSTAFIGPIGAQDHRGHVNGMSRFVAEPFLHEVALQSTVAPPLWKNLGALHYPVTANPEAQQYFDQGLRLAYAFNHAEAQRAFRRGQELDPACAMCYWGEALVLGPNINAPMAPWSQRAGPAGAGQGAGDHSVSDKEKALIAALATRYPPIPQRID